MQKTPVRTKLLKYLIHRIGKFNAHVPVTMTDRNVFVQNIMPTLDELTRSLKAIELQVSQIPPFLRGTRAFKRIISLQNPVIPKR